jgi:iron complex outermembrane receptor protein
MTLDNVKQVEIIRGPGSALYGSNAFLGVISIITNPNKKNVTARASSFSGKDISVNYAGDLGEGYYSFFAKAFSDKGETYRNVTDQIGKTDDETRDPRNGIDLYTVAGYDDFSITLRHSHREYDDFFFTGFLGDDINHSEADHSFIKLTYQPILMEKLDLDINVSHAVTEWDAKGFLFPAGFELAPGFALSNRVIAGPTIKSSHTEIKVDASYPLSENHIINAGIGFAKQEINDSSLQSTHNLVTFEFQGDGNLHTFKGDDSFIDNEDRTISSAYFQDKLILDAVTLIAGVRADNYSDFGSTVNPRLAVIYSTDWKSRFKFMFGSAYRAPAFDELYVRNNPQVQGNKNLKPEEIKTIELAYFQRLGNTEFSATLFHNTISEIITTTPITGSFSANTVINQGEEKVKGLEFEFNKPINNHLVMRGSYTMITSGVDNFSPNRSGSLIANYHQDRFNINLRTSYHGRIASIPTRGGYYLLNCAVNYKVNPSVSVQLSGQNLSNKDYLSPSSKTNLLQTPNRGRNVVAELEYKF